MASDTDEDESEGLLADEVPRLAGSAAVGRRRGWSSQRAAMEIRLADLDIGLALGGRSRGGRGVLPGELLSSIALIPKNNNRPVSRPTRHRSPLRGSGVVVKYRQAVCLCSPSSLVSSINSRTSPFLLLHFCPHSALQLHLSIRLFVPTHQPADVAGGFPYPVAFPIVLPSFLLPTTTECVDEGS